MKKKFNGMSFEEMKDFLDAKYELYCKPNFIPLDPIQIPHRFSKKEDIEISGFLTATISWGNRKSIITNASRMMELMGDEPHQFVLHASQKEIRSLAHFVHRTFNGDDFMAFAKGLQKVYQSGSNLERAFTPHPNESLQSAIARFKISFFEKKAPSRSFKHISDPEKGSSAKRLNMYLRWMVRDADKGVDFGIWKSIQSSQLSLPLDVHTGNVGRKLGLLKRTQNDAKAVAEIDEVLRLFDPNDPVKYDFSLFGLGAIEKF